MVADERGQMSDVFSAADVERHRATVGHRLLHGNRMLHKLLLLHVLRTRSLIVGVETVAGMMKRHRRISFWSQHDSRAKSTRRTSSRVNGTCRVKNPWLGQSFEISKRWSGVRIPPLPKQEV